MHVNLRRRTRRGGTLVEVAVVLPLLVMLTFAAFDAASGVYRYQEVATLAREGARYASVHAGMYAEENGKSVPTAAAIKAAALDQRSVNLDNSLLSCTLVWVNGSAYPYSVTSDTGQRKANNVRFTVSYQWKSLFLLGQTVTLSATSETTITY